MYAVFKLGGNQHKATVGDILTVQKLDGEVGHTVRIQDVLMVNTGEKVMIGTPIVPGASVYGEITQQDRGKKILVMKFKRKNRYRRKVGHRQPLTKIRVTKVVVE